MVTADPDELPESYATALRLHGQGASHCDISTALQIEVHSVALLLAIGQEKLDALRVANHGNSTREDGT